MDALPDSVMSLPVEKQTLPCPVQSSDLHEGDLAVVLLADMSAQLDVFFLRVEVEDENRPVGYSRMFVEHSCDLHEAALIRGF